ncbi:MAG: hypothetical protein PHG02_00980 [Oscillospiraceae bacterium]|nr:hypothetical protein [Oscillospiraceae bacterium]
MKENQKVFHILDGISDGVLLVAAVILAYLVRFHVLNGSEKRLPLETYLIGCIVIVPIMLVIYNVYGLYNAYSARRFEKECFTVFLCNSIGAIGVIGVLYTVKFMDVSRFTVALWLVFNTLFMVLKRVGVRAVRRDMSKKGLNRREVLIVGGGELASQYLDTITKENELGFVPIGYIAPTSNLNAAYLGDFSVLDEPVQARGAVGTTAFELSYIFLI